MKKAVWTGALTAAAFVIMSVPAFAQATATKTVSVTATVSARAKLALGTTAVSFADADPDVTSSIAGSTPVTVDVKARTSAAGTVTLTVVSNDDLKAGAAAIPISNLTWTTPDLTAGTMDKTTAQTLGSWTGSGNYTGTQNYALANSWTYNTGSYSATITYTLTAP